MMTMSIQAFDILAAISVAKKHFFKRRKIEIEKCFIGTTTTQATSTTSIMFYRDYKHN